ncbi:unnamed protein product [Withania somnifera]
MVMSTLLKFLYPPPPSLFITTMSFISFASLANAGFSEIKGKNMQYSKFFGTKKLKMMRRRSTSQELRVKRGCFCCIALHFWLVIFVHKYSGSMDVEATIVISSSYFLSTVTMIYCQLLTQGLPEPSIDLKYGGFIIFLVGIIGNLYHHILLSKLRTKGENEYKIPQGGLFCFAICPHYLFEILIFIGFSCTSQTLYSISYTLGTTVYLIGRSIATRRWYKSKFDDFPKDIKALIPYIF